MSSVNLAATSAVWQYRISMRTGEPAVPVFNHKLRGGCPYWVPKRYKALVAAVMDGRRKHIRDLAERTGYSIKGVWSALRALHAMGIITLTTVRGCKGWVAAQFNKDCSTPNVSTNVRSLGERLATFLRTGTLVETFKVETIDTGLEWPEETQ